MRKFADCLHFLAHEATAAIFLAVLTVCLFAFILDADLALTVSLLGIGGVTAIVEARMHTRRRGD
jgi:hypothetical protein